MRGIVPEQEDGVTDIGHKMRVGSCAALRPGEWGIVLGAELARTLAAQLGDKVTVITPQGQITPAGMVPRLKQFTVVGIFQVGMYEYDSGLALINLQDAQKLFRTGDHVSGRAPEARRPVPRAASGATTRQHAERRLLHPRLDAIARQFLPRGADGKTRDVHHPAADRGSGRVQYRFHAGDGGHRQAAGHRHPAHARRIARQHHENLHGAGRDYRFDRHRDWDCSAGVLLALNIGTVVPFIERTFGIHFLSSDVYQISELPSKLEWNDVWVIGLVALVLSWLATIYPSWRASRTNPAEALRYE